MLYSGGDTHSHLTTLPPSSINEPFYLLCDRSSEGISVLSTDLALSGDSTQSPTAHEPRPVQNVIRAIALEPWQPRRSRISSRTYYWTRKIRPFGVQVSNDYWIQCGVRNDVGLNVPDAIFTCRFQPKSNRLKKSLERMCGTTAESLKIHRELSSDCSCNFEDLRQGRLCDRTGKRCGSWFLRLSMRMHKLYCSCHCFEDPSSNAPRQLRSDVWANVRVG